MNLLAIIQSLLTRLAEMGKPALELALFNG